MITPFLPSAATLAGLVAVLVLGGAHAADSEVAPGDAGAVERGRYIAAAADCSGCHARDGGEAFSGDQAIESPLGTLYTSNITPDATTGIGD